MSIGNFLESLSQQGKILVGRSGVEENTQSYSASGNIVVQDDPSTKSKPWGTLFSVTARTFRRSSNFSGKPLLWARSQDGAPSTSQDRLGVFGTPAEITKTAAPGVSTHACIYIYIYIYIYTRVYIIVYAYYILRILNLFIPQSFSTSLRHAPFCCPRPACGTFLGWSASSRERRSSSPCLYA